MNGVIRFGHDQKCAIRKTVTWFNDKLYINTPIFVIGGYAGTGKSTVLSQILATINIPLYKVAFATYTGKAALVLRRKGLNAFTLHKLLYNTSISKTGNPIFKRKSKISSHIELICIDEFGMVPKSIIEDLLMCHVPIIALGDPGQLPPIFGSNEYMHSPHVFLTTIYRQGEGSGIIQLSQDIQSGVQISPSSAHKYGDNVVIIPELKFDITTLLQYDILICSTNETRNMLNTRCRTIRNFKQHLPCNGDKLICTVNNFKDSYIIEGIEFYLVNGLIGQSVSSVIKCNDEICAFDFKLYDPLYRMKVYAKTNPFIQLYYPTAHEKNMFINEPMFLYYNDKIVNTFEYGYAITAHKAQGSEWDHVLIYDDCFYNDEYNAIRWLYTAVTRAKVSVTIIKSNK